MAGDDVSAKLHHDALDGWVDAVLLQQPPPATTVIAAILGRTRSEIPPTPAWAVRVKRPLD